MHLMTVIMAKDHDCQYATICSFYLLSLQLNLNLIMTLFFRYHSQERIFHQTFIVLATWNDVVCIMLSFAFFLQLRSKIASATSAIKSVFGQEVQQEDAVGVFCPVPVKYCTSYVFLHYGSNLLTYISPPKGEQIRATQRKDGQSKRAFPRHGINRVYNRDNPNGNYCVLSSPPPRICTPLKVIFYCYLLHWYFSGDGNQWVIKTAFFVAKGKCSCKETHCEPSSATFNIGL